MTESTNTPSPPAAGDNQPTAASEEAQMRQARSLLIQRLTEELMKPNPKASLLAVAAKFLEGVKPETPPKVHSPTRLPFTVEGAANPAVDQAQSGAPSQFPFPANAREEQPGWNALDHQPFITA